MSLTLERLPDGMAIISSPLEIVPDAIVPEKPRKSRFGRFTHCTGKRNGVSKLARSTSTSSKNSSKAGPLYQGATLDFVVTLSPSKALTGIVIMSWKLRFLANVRKASSISLNFPWSKSTRSILFTATTTLGTPKRLEIKAWRRVCSITPWRASIRRIATSAVDAPVAIFRVY